MSTKIYAVDWSHTDEKLSVWDGKKITSKLPKAEGDIVLVAENIPQAKVKDFIEAGIPVLRCSPNASADYRKKYSYPKTDDNDAIIIYELYKASPAKFRAMKKASKLKQLYANYEQHVKQMTASKNRQWAAEDDDNTEYLKSMEMAKKLLSKKMERELKRMPIYAEFLSKIKGVGVALAAGLVSEIDDISKFDNVSNLNAYFGLHVVNGTAPKRQKGVVANWNPTGKALICELIPDQFVKQKSPVYNQIWVEEKEKCIKLFEADEAKKKPVEDRQIKSRMHAERRARRKAGKIFLHHVWKKWRELEGLPTPQPWVLEHGGHTKEILPPTDYPGLT